jgi:hypothetical protein
MPAPRDASSVTRGAVREGAKGRVKVARVVVKDAMKVAAIVARRGGARALVTREAGRKGRNRRRRSREPRSRRHRSRAERSRRDVARGGRRSGGRSPAARSLVVTSSAGVRRRGPSVGMASGSTASR